MTTSSALLDRAAHAAGERAGRDLKQWRTALPLTELAATKVKGTHEATGAAGGTLLTDVPILKAGTFHGGMVVIDEFHLAAMVARFGQLAPDVFVPPVRIDHSWNVMNVIGHIASLRVEVRPDASNSGTETPFLLADLQILDEQALDLIRKGILRNRSSEIGAYESNTGQLYTDVVWGVAFVDIPAVEGLGNVQLGKATPGLGAPHTVIELTEGGHVADDQDTEQTDETEQETSETASGQGDGSDQGDQGSGSEQDGSGEPGAAAGGQDGQGDQAGDGGDDGSGEQVGGDAGTHDGQDAAGELAARRASVGLRGDETPEEALRALGLTAQADALAQADRDAVDREIVAYGKKGVLGAAAHAPARALLGHKDPTVREHARSLLENAVAPVKLGSSRGKQTSETASGSRGDDAAVTAADFARAETLDELSDLFESMPPAARKDPKHELAKAFAERRRELAAS